VLCRRAIFSLPHELCPINRIPKNLTVSLPYFNREYCETSVRCFLDFWPGYDCKTKGEFRQSIISHSVAEELQETKA
jgi:hypothetical protein